MHYMLFQCGDGESTGRLRPAAEAVTVRVRDGRTVVTRGPFEATERQLTGFEVVEAGDLDEAIETAGARGGVVEVRPFWEG